MAEPSPSPALSNNSLDTTTTTNTNTTTTAGNNTANATATSTPPTVKGTTTTTTKAINNGSGLMSHRDPPKSLRGLNKPKCSKCGNVARSRCPFLCCKSCCAKAQNACHIHVLKASTTLPDKSPVSTSPLFDKQSTDATPSGTSLKVSTYRQLSQFNGTQIPYTPRRPLTRKDAVALNQWRFTKLKEYKESYIEAENEAFDRYMQNVGLLEEAFSVKSLSEGPNSVELPLSDPTSNGQDDTARVVISGLKAQLRSYPKRGDTFRQKIRCIVDQGLSNLHKLEFNDDEETTEVSDMDDLTERPKKAKVCRAERASALDDLIDKLNKARNEDDLQSCLQMKSHLFHQHEEAYSAETKAVEEQIDDNVSKPTKDSGYLFPKFCSRVDVNQETLQSIELHFCSLDQADQIDDL